MSAAPGWYPDPSDPSRTRWWDGTAWTGESHPAAPVATPQAPRPAPPVPGAAQAVRAANPDALRKRSAGAFFAGVALIVVAGVVLYSQFDSFQPDGGVLVLGWLMGAFGYMLAQAGVVGWVLTARAGATGADAAR